MFQTVLKVDDDLRLRASLEQAIRGAADFIRPGDYWRRTADID
jgi:hypothetical protein